MLSQTFSVGEITHNTPANSLISTIHHFHDSQNQNNIKKARKWSTPFPGLSEDALNELQEKLRATRSGKSKSDKNAIDAKQTSISDRISDLQDLATALSFR